MKIRFLGVFLTLIAIMSGAVVGYIFGFRYGDDSKFEDGFRKGMTFVARQASTDYREGNVSLVSLVSYKLDDWVMYEHGVPIPERGPVKIEALRNKEGAIDQLRYTLKYAKRGLVWRTIIRKVDDMPIPAFSDTQGYYSVVDINGVGPYSIIFFEEDGRPIDMIRVGGIDDPYSDGINRNAVVPAHQGLWGADKAPDWTRYIFSDK